jgi:hypothetical protein
LAIFPLIPHNGAIMVAETEMIGMFKTELKAELTAIYNSNKNIDKELVNIKVAIHNLEKLGCNTRDLEKMLDNIGIEFYKFKNENREIIKDWRD